MICFDIETIADPGAREPLPGNPPVNYTKPKAIEEWRDKDIKRRKAGHSKSHTTGMICLITACVDVGPISQFRLWDYEGGPACGYSAEEQMLLDFYVWMEEQDDLGTVDLHDLTKPIDFDADVVPQGIPHATCAYNGMFDWRFTAGRASRHGITSLARRMWCEKPYGDSAHVDPHKFHQCRLGEAAWMYGYDHHSMDGGRNVQGWWNNREYDRIAEHGIHDVDALRIIADHAVRCGIINPQR